MLQRSYNYISVDFKRTKDSTIVKAYKTLRSIKTEDRYLIDIIDFDKTDIACLFVLQYILYDNYKNSYKSFFIVVSNSAIFSQ